MRNLILEKETRHIYSRFWEYTFLLFCILGIAISIPIHAQQQRVEEKKLVMPSVSSNPPYGYSQVGTTMLWCRQDYYSIDFQGYYEGMYYGSTYSNGGYSVAIKVNDTYAKDLNIIDGSTIDGVNCVTTVEQQGELARVVFTVSNSNETDAKVSLGVYADVMIGSNDRAPIVRRKDTMDNTYGLTMMDGGGTQLCILFGSGLAGVNPVSDFWFGYYSTNRSADNIVGNYYSGSNYMQENGSYDSGMGWCWKDREIPAGGVVVFSYLIGVGEVNLEPNSSFEVTPDDPEGWNDLSRPHVLTLEGTYESPAGLDGMIEYAVEDSEEWHPLTEMLPSGSTFNNSLVAMFDSNRSKHTIRFRTRDNVGNTTMLHPIEYLDVAFYQYSGVQDKTYTGDSIYQELVCTDKSDLDFTTGQYVNNVNAGTAHFCVEGVFPNTIGRKSFSFQINPVAMPGDISISTDSYVYDGYEHRPEWTFTDEANNALEQGRDYIVEYTSNVYPGTGKVEVKGIGNYTANFAKTFTIEKAALQNGLYGLTLPDEDISYDGIAHGAQVYFRASGVGDVIFTYTKHGETAALPGAPTEEGFYDIYMEIAEGDCYFGKLKEYLCSFSIYRFDEQEWVALTNLYTQLQGMNASLSWDVTEGAKKVKTFPELTIKEGHLIGINLSRKELTGGFPTYLAGFPKLKEIYLNGNELSGDLSAAISEQKIANEEAFSSVNLLDISYNKLSGNLGTVAACMPQLKYLFANNNKFEELYPALPMSVETAYIDYQDMDKVLDLNLSVMKPSEVFGAIPSIALYDAYNHSYRDGESLHFYKNDAEGNEEWTLHLGISTNDISVNNYYTHGDFKGESGDVVDVYSMTHNQKLKAVMSFSQGDANFLNGVDASDLQITINYAFDGWQPGFNFTAADTYKDGKINVQDVVCTVNIILDADNSSAESKALYINKVKENANDNSDADAYIYLRDGKVMMHSKVPVAALSIKADGDIKWNLKNMGLQQTTSKSNVVAYSFNKVTLPCNEDIVLGEYTNATLRSVSLADTEARTISAGFSTDSATAIRGIEETNNTDVEIYDVSGYRRNTVKEGINIIRNNGTTRKFHKK